MYADISRYYKLLALDFERELFTLEDGGILAIDWFDGCPSALKIDSRPILVCIAGLAGTTNVTYINHVVKELSREFKCVFVQWRG